MSTCAYATKATAKHVVVFFFNLKKTHFSLRIYEQTNQILVIRLCIIQRG